MIVTLPLIAVNGIHLGKHWIFRAWTRRLVRRPDWRATYC